MRRRRAAASTPRSITIGTPSPLTADHTYTFSAFTTAGPLNDVAIVLRDANRNILNSQGVVDGGPNGQASFRYSTTVSGTFYLDVSAGGSNPVGVVGSYQAIFSDNGADTILDTPATTASLVMNDSVTGTIDPLPKTGSFDTSRDRDWLAVTLIAGHTYQFQAFALSGSLNDVAIDLRDANRNIVNSQGVVDAGAFGRPTFTYSATVGGTFYLDIGAGGSNPAGVTRTYDVSVRDEGADTILDTASTTASVPMNGLSFGVIDPLPESGSFDTSLDHDWFAVTLTAGHKYSLEASTTFSGNLNDLAIVLRDANRNILNSQGVVDSGVNAFSSAQFVYTAAVSGTYYLDVSAGGINPGSLTGGYNVFLTDLGLVPPDTVLDTAATTASLTMNGTVSGTIDALPASGSFNRLIDHDWYAVNLTAGERYTFSTSGTTLPDVAVALMNANRTIVDPQGLVDSGPGGFATISFTPTVSGTYYLAVGAGGSDAALGNSAGTYQITATDNGPNHLVINLTADQSVITQFGPNYQTSTFWMAVESAASFFESTFFDPITININVGFGEVNGFTVPSNSAESFRNQQDYSFSQIIAALQKDANSASDATAVAHLPSQDPGLGGIDFRIANAEAKALGLPVSANPSTPDGSVGFATD